MKVYILTREYDNDFRVTVADDVEMSSYDRGQDKGMHVSFRLDDGKYNTTTLAGFAGIDRVVLVGKSIKVEENQWKADKVKGEKAAPTGKNVWTIV
jgi:hypothetical protein